MGHTHRCQLAFKKKKNQVKSPSPESRIPETGSDPPIRSDRDSGRDTNKFAKNGQRRMTETTMLHGDSGKRGPN